MTSSFLSIDPLWAKRLSVPFAFIFAGGFLAHTLTFIYMRYRIPFLDAGLIVFSAIALQVFLGKVFPRLFSGKNGNPSTSI